MTGQSSSARFSDWTALQVEDRARILAACRARAQANAFNAFVSTGGPEGGEGPFAGLPFALKDLFAFDGHRPACGLSRQADAWSPPVEGSSPLVARLVAAGGACVGTLNMSQIAFEPTGANAALGRPVNPWNPDAVTGGSSSGSGVAVAAGQCVIALGSDTGGSVRMPAHSCGITGLKPSYGRLPLGGAMLLCRSLDTIGPMARSAAEAMLAFEVLAGGPGQAEPIRRVAFAVDCAEESDPDVAVCVRAFAEAVRAAGVEIVPRAVRPFIAECDGPLFTLMQGEAFAAHSRLLAEASPLEPVTRKRLERGRAIANADLEQARAAAARLARVFETEVLDGVDALILPVSPARTPFRAEADADSPAFQPKLLYLLSAFTRFANLIGAPALALPCGFDARGCPVGAQVVGRRRSDEALLALGVAVQRLSDWHGRIPPAVRDVTLAAAPDPERAMR
jgi:Asp-tRNA(Asn)/Glu-tRNA(Gln) amidotransferase A subunit family amidase